MKPCLNQATIMQCDVEEFIKVTAHAGFKWVELRIPKVEEYLLTHPAGEFRALLRSEGVKVATLNALEFFSLVPEENYGFMKAKAEKAAALCQLIDCEWLIVVPSRKNNLTREEIVEMTARRLELLAEAAQKYGVKLLFEFIGFPDFSVTDLSTAYKIAKTVRRHEIKLVIDTFHFFVGGTTLEDLKKTPGKDIGLVHVNDFPDRPLAELTDAMRVLPGMGRADLRSIMRGLKEIGFDGLVSLELFNEELWRLAPQEAAGRAWQSLQLLF
ncbi:MAG: sugar phosphate isomerase/epimerase family protein [Bacillota bacterium]